MLDPNFDYVGEPNPDKAFVLCQIFTLLIIIIIFSIVFVFAGRT